MIQSVHAPAKAARPGLGRRFVRAVRKYKYLYLMLILPIAYYLIFCYWPMYGLQIAFKKYNIRLGVEGSPWIGLYHFKDYFTDAYFWKVVRNTLLINVYTLIFAFPAPILLALLLNELRNEYYKKIVQSISYVPHFLSTVVICGMIVNFLSNSGPINDLIERFGGERVQFLMIPGYFRTIYVATGIWQNVGWSSIIYFAAIANTDPQLYEAAIIDGAGRFKQAVHVTIPSIIPTITIMLIMQVGSMLSLGYEKIILLYNGSTYETADVISSYVYRKGILGADYSYSSAVGMFSSVLGLIFIYGANWFSRTVSENSLW